VTAQLTPLVPLDGVGDLDPERSVRKKLRLAFIAVGVLVVGLILAATIIRIGGAVIGSGSVAVESRPQEVAHPQGGVLSEVLVREGQRVRAGDLLMRLDTSVSAPSAALTSGTVDQLLARRGRLEAEREGRATVSFPAELARRNDPAAQSAMAAEARLFYLRRQERAGSIAQLNERVQQTNEQIRSYAAQINALNQQSQLIEPERRGVRELWDKNLVTIGRLNQLERSAVDLQGSAAALQANIAQSRARISETREQMISVNATARAEAGAELAQVNTALNDQQVRQVNASDALQRSEIRAPTDGVVERIAYTTIGSTVPPNQIMVVIIPDRDTLIVEGRISPTDIERVQRDQPARVRFSGRSAQTTPEVAGTVTFVSADRTTDTETQDTYYRVRIQLNPAAVREAGLELTAGELAEIFIETGERSMLSYILKPLVDQFQRAFRDG
jgi:HlyD family secretion protein